jgi:hypothetical protein
MGRVSADSGPVSGNTVDRVGLRGDRDVAEREMGGRDLGRGLQCDCADAGRDVQAGIAFDTYWL